jgi:hypothetical protein
VQFRARQQRLHRGVVAVDDAHGPRAEDARLGRAVGGHRAVPVEVVLRQVQDGRGVGLEAPGGARQAVAAALELEARQFQHQNLGQCRGGVGVVGGQPLGQHVQQRRADVAGHGHRLAGALHQQRGHRGGGGLAVGAGDGQHAGRVAARGLQVGQRAGEQVQFAQHGDAGGAGLGQQRRDALVGGRQPRALQHQLAALQQRGLGRARAQRHARVLGGQCRGTGRLLARIPHRHRRAVPRAPARHGQAAGAEAQHEDGGLLQPVHRDQRSFRLARPTRHSSIVMIQKRTTTCVSAQPFFSKWWCSGAIRNTRRPVP